MRRRNEFKRLSPGCFGPAAARHPRARVRMRDHAEREECARTIFVVVVVVVDRVVVVVVDRVTVTSQRDTRLLRFSNLEWVI